jgi:hypothetical protein
MAEKLGPAGEYPFGEKIFPGDKGGLNAGLRVINGKIIIFYAVPVEWVAIMPDEAIRLGELLIAKAKEIKRG